VKIATTLKLSEIDKMEVDAIVDALTTNQTLLNLCGLRDIEIAWISWDYLKRLWCLLKCAEHDVHRIQRQLTYKSKVIEIVISEPTYPVQALDDMVLL
jgi:hypothetical protein